MEVAGSLREPALVLAQRPEVGEDLGRHLRVLDIGAVEQPPSRRQVVACNHQPAQGAPGVAPESERRRLDLRVRLVDGGLAVRGECGICQGLGLGRIPRNPPPRLLQQKLAEERPLVAHVGTGDLVPARLRRHLHQPPDPGAGVSLDGADVQFAFPQAVAQGVQPVPGRLPTRGARPAPACVVLRDRESTGRAASLQVLSLDLLQQLPGDFAPGDGFVEVQGRVHSFLQQVRCFRDCNSTSCVLLAEESGHLEREPRRRRNAPRRRGTGH